MKFQFSGREKIKMFEGSEKRMGLGFLIFSLAAMLQFWFLLVFDFKVDFILVSLIVLALFLSFEEMILLVLAGVWLLNWQRSFSLEILYFLIIPMVVIAFRRLLPGKLGVTNFMLVLLGVMLFYTFSNFSIFFSRAVNVPLVSVPAVIFGSILFFGLRRLFRF